MTRPLTRRILLALPALAAAPPVLAQGKSGAAKTDPAASVAPATPGGWYSSYGLNTDGTSYTGRAEMIAEADSVTFTWYVDGDVIRGRGRREGRVITVDWGGTSPVVYVVMPDGTLHGTWEDGLALEKLTPQ